MTKNQLGIKMENIANELRDTVNQIIPNPGSEPATTQQLADISFNIYATIRNLNKTITDYLP